MSDRHELERLLREPVDGLTPPDGTWERIQRRARRRRWISASASVAAVMVIVAGAVPAVLAVRHNADNATLALDGRRGHSPAPRPVSNTTNSVAPAPAGPLSGYFPESLSFVSPSVGYLWGSTGTSRAGVVARTLDAGASWTELPAPGVNNEFVSPRGAAQIRFASGQVGFLYGEKNLITRDAGESWQPFVAPGYIADLEAMNQRIWALVRPSASSRSVRLYAATAADPRLKPVRGVPVMHGLPGTPEIAGAASIAVSGARVDVIVGATSYFSSPDGTRWVSRTNPCPSSVKHAAPRTTLVTTTDTLGIAVACGYNVTQQSETKLIYQSVDSGKDWQPLPTQPAARGLLQTFAAGSRTDLILGSTHGNAQITHDGGRQWVPALPAPGVRLSFVGFIDINHIVAVADRSTSSIGSFAASYTSGKTWMVTPFTP